MADSTIPRHKGARNDLTAGYVRSLLNYNPKTGVLRWRVVKAPQIPVGSVAGSTSTKGYRDVMIDGRSYRAHRLIWLIVTGEWPTDQIDHANKEFGDNRWKNLREADNSQNCCNRGISIRNVSGLKGAHLYRDGTRWVARIKHQQKEHHIGIFKTARAAHNAYLAAAKRLHGDFMRKS